MDAHEIQVRTLEHEEKKFAADLEIRRAELELRREQLKYDADSESKKPIWNTAPGIAVIGGVITLLSAVASNALQAWNSSSQREKEHQAQIDLERHKFQSDLIQKAIERGQDSRAAATNLNFLWEAGLITDYKEIPGLLEKYKDEDQPAWTLPSAKTFGTVTGGIRGTDDRIRVIDTGRPPHDAICHLQFGAEKLLGWGTGFLVAPRVVLTAAHNLPASRDGQSTVTIVVSPGRNGESYPYGQYQSTKWLVSQKWRDEKDRNANYGVVILPEPVTSIAPIELRSLGDEQLLGTEIRIAGYPDKKPAGAQWMDTGKIQVVELYGYDYQLDTGPGVSGAPVLAKNQGQTVAIGIHYAGNGIRAVRLTDSVIQEIRGWIDENP
jgi:glutamyl endopeptidase